MRISDWSSDVCSSDLGAAHVAQLQARNNAQQARLDDTRREAQREVNALAARMGELQAEANRLNALGERLTRIGQLGDGEFDFDKPVGIGGEGPVRDMAAGTLRSGMGELGMQLADSGKQLSVLESLLFNRELDRSATPSRMPILNTYITSGYGGRADPFGGGRAFHKGIDFHARTGDPVLAVADGVVSFSGRRSGYGKVVEVDHGNGYVTRYAHNSRSEEHKYELQSLMSISYAVLCFIKITHTSAFHTDYHTFPLPAALPISNRNPYSTSGYGGRANPSGGGGAFHKGSDYHARTGDPVLAVADGVVSFSGRRSGYGKVVEVDHGNGYVTRYAHNSRLGVQVGDLVRSGQQIAKAGSTGRSTGAHVHFEVWQDGRVLNPRKFLGEHDTKRM